MEVEPELKITRHILRRAIDPVKTARAVNLIYVSDRQEGFTRVRKGKSFYYFEKNKKITDKEVLDRIRNLVIPPAWENVWICKHENGHLQVTGTDALRRKQYRYHPDWNCIRNQTKFYRLLEFGAQLPSMRTQMAKHLSMQGYPREKILAAVVSLLEQTSIRIGNTFYEKLYGSFGLTTFKNHHVDVTGTKIVFSFKGKKGVQHLIGLRSKKLANIIKACKEIPGKDLFQYIDEAGNVNDIDSGMVNEYIHSLSGADFTAKDFRTWSGSVQALAGFREIGGFTTAAEMNRNMVAVIDLVAKQLGNTRAVCKKYYIHPVILKLYEEEKLEKFFTERYPENTDRHGLSDEENILIRILENN